MEQPLETIMVGTLEVPCEGGGGALGHPKVYLHINRTVGYTVCPYCSRTYKLRDDANRYAASGH